MLARENESLERPAIHSLSWRASPAVGVEESPLPPPSPVPEDRRHRLAHERDSMQRLGVAVPDDVTWAEDLRGAIMIVLAIPASQDDPAEGPRMIVKRVWVIHPERMEEQREAPKLHQIPAMQIQIPTSHDQLGRSAVVHPLVPSCEQRHILFSVSAS